MTRPVTVGAWPAYRKARENAYTALFADALSSHDVVVTEFHPHRFWRGFDAVIVHWPEIALNRRSPLQRFSGALATLGALSIQRLRRAEVVWVTHNDGPHENHSPVATHLFYGLFTRVVTAMVHPSFESGVRASRLSKRLARLPSIVIPHGPYPSVPVDSALRTQVDIRFGVQPSERMLLYFGQIRGYKGVPDLIRAFRFTSAPDLRLVVVGECADDRLRAEIVAAHGLDPRMTLDLRHQDLSTLAALLDRADLVVLPFKEVLNSGSVIHALGAGRRVLTTDAGSIRSIADQAGPDRVRFIDGVLTADQIDAAIAWTTEGEPPPSGLFSDTSWDDAGGNLSQWLRTILNTRRGRCKMMRMATSVESTIAQRLRALRRTRGSIRSLLERVLPAGANRVVQALYYAVSSLLPSFATSEPDLKVALDLVRPGDLVIDGGANVGRYTLPLSKAVGPDGVVIAVEPVPRTRLLLSDILRLRRARNVHTVQMALSDRAGTAVMSIPASTTSPGRNFYRATLSTGGERDDSFTVDVATTTLDALLDRSPLMPRLVKLDLEGHELRALRGAGVLLAGQPAMLLELGSDPDDPTTDSAQLESVLRGAGYGIFWFDPEHRSLRRRVAGQRPVNIWALTYEHLRNLRPDLVSLVPRTDGYE